MGNFRRPGHPEFTRGKITMQPSMVHPSMEYYSVTEGALKLQKDTGTLGAYC